MDTLYQKNQCYTVYMGIKMDTHIVQTGLWAKFKESFGTPAVEAGGAFYTKHKIPFTNYFYAYCPRVNPAVIKFSELRKSLEENQCIAIHFDVPNVVKGTPEEAKSLKIFEKGKCIKSSREEFAKGNILLDLSPSEEELLAKMHHKQRYNVRLAEKKGVKVRPAAKPLGKDELDIFYTLYKETAQRQGYFFRPKVYIEKLFKIFDAEGKVHILTIEYEGEPLASWFLFHHEDTLYYPYGGSSLKHKNLQASSLIGWEAIKLGKKLKCKTFDMWGAGTTLEDSSDPYYGFTLFKSRFGGELIIYMDSYDLVLNTPMYTMFTQANNLRWKLLKFIK
jgi:lipid II:glycine glycyltransferase (peptidoglycan interpeptide bridge formation enzyme)